LDGINLPFVETHKYLGMLLNDKLSDGPDIICHIKSFYARGNVLINRCSVDVKNYLFKTYLSSLYGAALWCNFTKASFKRCTVAYNDIYRYLFCIPRGESMSAIYVDNGIDALQVLLRKNMYTFICRILGSSNTLISALVTSNFFEFSALSLHWKKELYL
jgi:hypothetical protein